MRRGANFKKDLQVKRPNLMDSGISIDKVNMVDQLNYQKISTGLSKPSLSEFLGAYGRIVESIKSKTELNVLHTIELNEFEVEIVTGIAGFQNNELKLKI